jgi:hypothetical protein
MKMYGELDAFLNLVLHGGAWSHSWHGCFNPEEGACITHCIGDWIGTTADLHTVEKKNLLPMLVTESRFLSCPVCSSSLYQLSYLGSLVAV